MHLSIQLYVEGLLTERFACMCVDDSCGRCRVRFACYTCVSSDEINVSMTHGEYTKWWNDKKRRPKRSSSYYSRFF